MKKTATLNEKLLKRLKSYALTAGAMAGAANAADAQEVIYTDVDPDQQANTIGDSIYLDLNNDGTDDFLFFADSFSFTSFSLQRQRVFASPLGDNAIHASLSGTYAYPYVLPTGNAIDANLSWQNVGNAQTMAWEYFGLNTSVFGNWINITDGYLGLRLDLNGQTHYGWARFDVSAGMATLKDYAFESLACLGIEAGSQTSIAPTSAATVSAIAGSDVGNAGNGSDMQIDITINAGGDANVSEYRVFVVKAENSSAFDQAAAEAVAMGNYTAVSPTGANINLTLDGAANDVDGNAIVSNQAYRIFVWSGANCDDSQLNSFSAPSEEVILEFPAGVNESNIPGLSIFTNGNTLNVINFSADNVNKPMSVFNTQGQLVASEMISGVQSSVDLSLASGLYIVSMNVNGVQRAHKIIIQ